MVQRRWLMLVYRVPTKPARWRMTIRRDLQRIGGLFLQQCVSILPQRDDLYGELERVTATITGMGGEYILFDIPVLRSADEEKIIAAFRDLRDREYAEIVAECEGMLAKEIEFAYFQRNYTVAEVAEIGQSLEKVRRWYDRVVSQDWFEAAGCKIAETWIARCKDMLADFQREVCRTQTTSVPRDTVTDVCDAPRSRTRRRVARTTNTASGEGIGE